MSKYNAQKTEVDGIKFDSKFEASVYLKLKSIEGLEIKKKQDKIYLSKANILFKPDFLCRYSGVFFFVEAKGMPTPSFQIKKRLFKAYGYDPLLIITSKGIEVVVPDNCACDASSLPPQLTHAVLSKKHRVGKASGRLTRKKALRPRRRRS